MILTFYFLLNMIVVYVFFFRMKKNLRAIEVLTYWFLASILFQNFSALHYMNFKTLIIPEIFSHEMAHLLNRMILIPVLYVWFLNQYIVLQTLGRKISLIALFLLLFLGLEWLADWLKVLVHKNWQMWWSLLFWILSMLMTVAFMRFFRKLLAKGR